jgi:choline monooxygenase
VDWSSEAAWQPTREPVARSTALDPSAYTSASVFELEQDRVFRHAWVCIGLTGELAGTGRLLVRRVGGRSVIVTRDHGGQLRGFLNACRHRGTELAPADCDIGATIRCPYHRWGYGLDGSLLATPLFDTATRDRFDPDEHGLVPVRVDTWGPLLFACLSDATPPLDRWLGDLPERMAGYRFDSFVSRHERELPIDANWKLISENFQEYYHLPWIHPELAKVSRVRDHYRYQGPGMYCGQTTTPISGDARDDWLVLPTAPWLDGSDSISGRFLAIFPNVLVSVLPNHVWVMRLHPVAPGHTVETCTLLVPESTGATTDEQIAPTLEFWIDVNAQDIDIVERGQRGLTHGGVPAGPLVPEFEEPLHRFHNMLADCMTRDGLADIVVPPGDLDRERTGR